MVLLHAHGDVGEPLHKKRLQPLGSPVEGEEALVRTIPNNGHQRFRVTIVTQTRGGEVPLVTRQRDYCVW